MSPPPPQLDEVYLHLNEAHVHDPAHCQQHNLYLRNSLHSMIAGEKR